MTLGKGYAHFALVKDMPILPWHRIDLFCLAHLVKDIPLLPWHRIYPFCFGK